MKKRRHPEASYIFVHSPLQRSKNPPKISPLRSQELHRNSISFQLGSTRFLFSHGENLSLSSSILFMQFSSPSSISALFPLETSWCLCVSGVATRTVVSYAWWLLEAVERRERRTAPRRSSFGHEILQGRRSPLPPQDLQLRRCSLSWSPSLDW